MKHIVSGWILSPSLSSHDNYKNKVEDTSRRDYSLFFEYWWFTMKSSLVYIQVWGTILYSYDKKSLVYIDHSLNDSLYVWHWKNRHIKLNYITLVISRKKNSVWFFKYWNYRASFIKESAEIFWVIKGILTTSNLLEAS